MANPYAANPCSGATEDELPTTEGNGVIRIKRPGGYWERGAALYDSR